MAGSSAQSTSRRRHGRASSIAPATADYRPTDPQVAWHLARFIERVRSIPADPIIVRQNWLRAYEWTTDRGAAALNDYARANDPFAKVGKQQVAVEASSVIRASVDSFRVAWTERRYEDGKLSATERWTAILTIVIQTPRDAERLRANKQAGKPVTEGDVPEEKPKKPSLVDRIF